MPESKPGIGDLIRDNIYVLLAINAVLFVAFAFLLASPNSSALIDVLGVVICIIAICLTIFQYFEVALQIYKNSRRVDNTLFVTVAFSMTIIWLFSFLISEMNLYAVLNNALPMDLWLLLIGSVMFTIAASYLRASQINKKLHQKTKIKPGIDAVTVKKQNTESDDGLELKTTIEYKK